MGTTFSRSRRQSARPAHRPPASRGRGPILFITANLKDAETLLADYEFFSGEKGFLFPNKPTLGAEVDAESHELENQRVLALSMAATARPCLVAAPATALLELLPPPEHIREGALELAPGDTAAIEELSASLDGTGLSAGGAGRSPGSLAGAATSLTCSRRGGTSPHPIL